MEERIELQHSCIKLNKCTLFSPLTHNCHLRVRGNTASSNPVIKICPAQFIDEMKKVHKKYFAGFLFSSQKE